MAVSRLRVPGGKTIIWAIVIIVVWFALHNNRFLEALFLFLTIGEIPFTNVRLSSDTVLSSLPFAFILIVIAIFHKECWRLLRHLFRRQGHAAVAGGTHDTDRPRRRPDHTAPEHGAVPVAAHPIPRPEVIAAIIEDAPPVHRPAKRRKRRNTTPAFVLALYRLAETAAARLVASQPWLAARLKRIAPQIARLKRWYSRTMHRAVLAVLPLLQKAAYYVSVGTAAAAHYCRIAWQRLRTAARFSWRIIRIESRNLARFSHLQARRFWVWLSPYLWKADRWLGTQFDALVRHPYVRNARHVIRGLARDVKRLLRK